MIRPPRAAAGALVTWLGLVASVAATGCDRLGCAPELPTPQGHVELAAPIADPNLPNVLIVLVDTTRADHLGFMGHERATTPHLDAFAERSIVFENHHSNSSRTGPSVASIFTGRHPGAHGVLNPLTHFDAKGRLSASQVTLAERLHDAGYATYGIVTNINASARFGFAQGFDAYEYFPDRDRGRSVNRMAFEILDQHDPRTGPIFLYLHYMGPHSPYVCDPEFEHLFALPDYDGPIDGSHEQLDTIVDGQLVPDARDFDQLSRLYDQDVRTFDERFGELMAGLRERDLEKDTIILFVADHGEELGDHGSVLHGYTLYEEVLRVPFVLHEPGLTSGRRRTVTTQHIDVMPMVLDLLHLPPEPTAQGRADLDGSTDPEIFAQVQLRAVKTVRVRSLQLGSWKLIENLIPSRRAELYDLARDPHEHEDLSEQQKERVVAMTEGLRRVDRADAEGEPPPEDLLTLTTDEIAELRALGYVGQSDEEEGAHDDPRPASERRRTAPRATR